MELGIDAQRDQKRGMLERLGLVVDAVHGDARELGYRWSSKRVAYEHEGLRLGSWSRGTHRGASMRGCLVDHPRIARAFDELEDVARKVGLSPYDEGTGEGTLRYAWAKTDGERVLLTLIEAREGAVERSIAEQLETPAGVAFAAQPSRSNAIVGLGARTERGLSTLRIDGLDIGPLGFLQPNPSLIERAYDSLTRDESDKPLSGELAWDVYAGRGAVSRRLRASYDDVVEVESDAELTSDPTDAEAFLQSQTQTPSLLVLNPPRRGLGEKVCEAVVSVGAPRLHIMSCGPLGLARDLKMLTGYRLASLTAYDTLPQTPHVELVAKLLRG